jgi:hydrogenase expression/formation protein HypC
MRVLTIDGFVGTATDGRETVSIDLSLTGPVEPGAWVLTFLGAAREVIAADEAARITAALDALRSVMRGGDVGDAFADIESAGPRLPPHLEAARAVGLSEA